MQILLLVTGELNVIPRTLCHAPLQIGHKISIHPVLLGALVTWEDWVNLIGDIILAVWVFMYIYDHIMGIRVYFTQPPRSCAQCSVLKIKSLGLRTLVVCTNCQNPFDPMMVSFCPECYKDMPKMHTCWKVCPPDRDAIEGKGPQSPPQRRLGRRLEEVAEAVGGGYCRLQMPFKIGTCRQGDSGWA